MNFRWKTNGNDYIDFWLADVCCHFKKKKICQAYVWEYIFNIKKEDRACHTNLFLWRGRRGHPDLQFKSFPEIIN